MFIQGYFPANVDNRARNFHAEVHVPTESVLLALEGMDVTIILFVIEGVRCAVLGQERDLLAPYPSLRSHLTQPPRMIPGNSIEMPSKTKMTTIAQTKQGKYRSDRLS
jgi:hypothetical protein